MKIAVVSDDHQTISLHFGRATFYEVFTIENGKVTWQHTFRKSNHQQTGLNDSHEAGHQHNHDHNAMMEPILDCDALIARGMGNGAFNALKIRNIEPFITELKEIDAAISAYLAGRLVNHLEKLH